MRKFIVTVAAISIAVTPAFAAPCRDAKGRFVKCPATAAKPATGVTKDKTGKCHVASGPKKGQFTKCM
ncbi:hypothetical protein ACLB0R_06990 [Sphingomonas sp. GlSt437]|uniref:hypothetical protein n=1 Tax=Sphingomonas sp. GlSt437 TaxID=3389970 RepID=UPI003A859705